MDSPFDTPHQEAAHASTKLRIVLRDDNHELCDEHLKILTSWVAAQKIHGMEARILELRLLSQETRTDDVRGAIDGAIEDCELNLDELRPESVTLIPRLTSRLLPFGRRS